MFQQYMADLKTGTMVPAPPDEPWDAMIKRINTEGQINEVTAETYEYFRDVLPPRWIGKGYAFAEGDEPLTLFWPTFVLEGVPLKRRAIYLARLLSWEQSEKFIELARNHD